MCLAVPAKLIEVHGEEGLADLHGNRVRVTTVLVPEVVPGDWILMHAGFAIQRLDPESAQRTWAVLKDLSEATSELPEHAEGDPA